MGAFFCWMMVMNLMLRSGEWFCGLWNCLEYSWACMCQGSSVCQWPGLKYCSSVDINVELTEIKSRISVDVSMRSTESGCLCSVNVGLRSTETYSFGLACCYGVVDSGALWTLLYRGTTAQCYIQTRTDVVWIAGCCIGDWWRFNQRWSSQECSSGYLLTQLSYLELEVVWLNTGVGCISLRLKRRQYAEIDDIDKVVQWTMLSLQLKQRQLTQVWYGVIR